MKLQIIQTRTWVLGIILGLFSICAMAGSGHDHGHSHDDGHSHGPVDQSTAKKNAEKIVESLVKKNKVDESWAAISAASVEKKEFNGKSEWVVVFVNEKISNADKQKLYVFLTMGGDYVAANFSGK